MTAAIALNRFGLGSRPDEGVPPDPKAWLLDQFRRFEMKPAAWRALPSSDEIARDLVDVRMEIREVGEAGKVTARKEMRQDHWEIYRQSVNARMTSALVTAAPFVERLVHFWANHFAVSTDKLVVIPFAGTFEMEAIRPHVLGRFEDMLLAVERHPAMQLYLDQTRSAGPASALAMRAEIHGARRMPGLNENLAREILELHTLGVRSGYSQADVTELARALTGWTIAGLGREGRGVGGEIGRFLFDPTLHEPGTRRILGKNYAQPGEAQARAALLDFAIAPATATHIATKLARHFVSDDPPPALIGRLANVFVRSGGDLTTLYRELVAAPECWTSAVPKFKSPWEWLISVMRGTGMRDLGQMQGAPILQQLGQPVWRPGSPAGFDDVAARWAAPDALVRRVEVAERFATRISDDVDPRTLADRLLPGAVSSATRTAIARADSPATGLALLLVSPEFLRR